MLGTTRSVAVWAVHFTDTAAVKLGSDGVGATPHVAWPVPEVHVSATSSTFAVPKQGSPNVVVLGKTTHADLPTQDATTTLVELAAAQPPAAKVGQLPEGVPYDAKATREIVAPGSAQVIVTRVSAIGGGPPFAHVAQKIGPSAEDEGSAAASSSANAWMSCGMVVDVEVSTK